MSPRFAATEALRLRQFEDGTIVFNPDSWDAHLLNSAAAAVLEMCMVGPTTKEDVEAFLADALSTEGQSCAASHAERLLAELVELGLVRACDPNALE
jgi:PqqD family protein of HPr-rel-A system